MRLYHVLISRTQALRTCLSPTLLALIQNYVPSDYYITNVIILISY
nr:MAG TPA: hypothetical protein [Caudoviricetes sp.]